MDDLSLRLASLDAALETDFHGDVMNLLNNASRIYMYLHSQMDDVPAYERTVK